LNKKQKEKGKHHEDARAREHAGESVANETKHQHAGADTWLHSNATEHRSEKDHGRKSLMASEKENSGVYEGISRFAESCISPAGAKKAAAWYIDTTEKLATQALNFQAKATEWAKETPIYPLIEAQQSIGRKLVEQSVNTARSLWRL